MGWMRFLRRVFWHDERRRELDAYLEQETTDHIARAMTPKPPVPPPNESSAT
jgi:hypothetical protein